MEATELGVDCEALPVFLHLALLERLKIIIQNKMCEPEIDGRQ